MYRAGLVLAACALAVASCSGSDSAASTTTEPATAATTTEAVTPAPTTEPVTIPSTTEPATTEPATTEPATTEAPAETADTGVPDCPAVGDLADKTSGDLATLSPLIGTDIRTAAKDCFEEVAIHLTTGTDPSQFPAWSVGYVDDPVPDAATGGTVEIAGEATLLFQMSAPMPAADGEGYSGPTSIVPADLAHVLELRQTANVDGTTSWAIGLDAEYPFTAVVPDGPARIVIQIQVGG